MRKEEKIIIKRRERTYLIFILKPCFIAKKKKKTVSSIYLFVAATQYI